MYGTPEVLSIWHYNISHISELATRLTDTCINLFSQGSYGRAFAHYLLVLKLAPENKSDIKESFTLALREWSEHLEQAGRIQDLFTCYQQACELFPECETMLNNMGAQLFK